LGVERFEDGDDPGQPADAGPSKDAGRSGEVPSSSDIGRARDQTRDSSPRESPEDVADKQAEPRTRDEYADHLAPPGNPPLVGDSPKRKAEESGRPEDDHLEVIPLEEKGSRDSSAEQQQAEDRSWVGSDLEGADEQPPGPDPYEPGSPEDAYNGKPDDGKLQAPPLARGLGSETDVPRTADTHKADDERSIGTLDHQDVAQENHGGPESSEDTSSQNDTADATQHDDQPNPLTNQEWAEHLDNVRDGLDQARKAGLRTSQLYTIDGKGQIWSEERDLLHDSILEDFYAKAKDVPCDFKAIMAGGLGGAGKTTVLTEHAGINLTQFLMINPDDFKEEMAQRGMLPDIEGLSPMEASDLAHEESSYLAKRLARRAEADGMNLIWDITMASQDSTAGRMESLREAGYAQVDGIFVDIPIEVSIKRTESRHREGYEKYLSGVGPGGRFVPPEVIRSQGDKEWSSQNRRTFEAVKGSFSSWRVYDNSVEDRPAALIESSKEDVNRRR
jgi:predicted ABC-type ATPase